MAQQPQPLDSQPVSDNLSELLSCLSPLIRRSIEEQRNYDGLLEVVLDLGRLPEARFLDREVYLDSSEVTDQDIQYVIERLSPFGGDNRAGIERTLHRISAIRNRSGKIVGLTCRVGRAIFGTVRVIEDLVTSGKSILVVGRPGVGKTTMLREMARVLADTAGKRVVIVDTSNEIAGDGDIPHPAIGKARRMQVPAPELQHGVMIEAVENHMPEVIIVDEMGTEQEAAAARTIAERGVQLVATAHGNTLENLIVNPTLSDLVGGIQTVTLSDEEARRRRTQKSILERKAPPTFDVLVEIQGWRRVAIHVDVTQAVDRLLRGESINPEVRWVDEAGHLHQARERRQLAPRAHEAIIQPAGRVDRPSSEEAKPQQSLEAKPLTRVHSYGVNKEHLEQAIRAGHAPAQLVDALANADLVLTTKSHYRRDPRVLKEAEELGKPVFVLRRNTPAQIYSFLRQIGQGNGQFKGEGPGEVDEAQDDDIGVQETEGITTDANGQGARVRQVQRQLAEPARPKRHRQAPHTPTWRGKP